MSNDLDLLYREIILDHYKSPRGRKPLSRVDLTAEGFNPSCGDEIIVSACTNGGKIEDVAVDCKGCAISIASGSMLAETIKGMSLEQSRLLAESIRSMLKGEAVELPDELGDLASLQGVRQFPVRIKCALLAWVTYLEAISQSAPGNRAPATTEDGL